MKTQDLVDLIAGRPLLTKADLAIRYKVTIRTINNWLKAGCFPRPVFIHGPRFKPSEVQKWEANPWKKHLQKYPPITMPRKPR